MREAKDLFLDDHIFLYWPAPPWTIELQPIGQIPATMSAGMVGFNGCDLTEYMPQSSDGLGEGAYTWTTCTIPVPDR